MEAVHDQQNKEDKEEPEGIAGVSDVVDLGEGECKTHYLKKEYRHTNSIKLSRGHLPFMIEFEYEHVINIVIVEYLDAKAGCQHNI